MKRAIILVAFSLGCCIGGWSLTASAGRPYTDPTDMRPDLLPHPIYNNWVPYRTTYNRPRFLGGYLANVIEPTSQEAYAWQESHRAGYYGTHCPTPIKQYNYLKPWEALNVGPRTDPALIEKYKNDRPQ